MKASQVHKLLSAVGMTIVMLFAIAGLAYAQTQNQNPQQPEEEEPEEIELADGPWVGKLGRCREINEEEPLLVRVDFEDANGNIRDKRKFFVRWDTLNDKTGRWVVLGIWCPHLKCAVKYEPDMGIFDCPCCDSQFALDGRVIAGRAKEPLVNYSDEVYQEDAFLKLEVEPVVEKP